MASMYSSSGSQNRELLRRLLLARLIAQMQQQQQQGKKPDSSTADKIFDALGKAQQYYNTGKNIYNLYQGFSGPGTSISSGATAAPSGFSSVGEMVGNGLYTPANSGGAQMQTSSTGPTSSVGDAASASGVSWGDVAPYINTAIAAYNAWNIYKDKDMPQGQKNLALAAQASQASTPVTGGYGSAAAGAFNAGAALKGEGTEEEKTQAAAHQAAMAVANYWTAGLAGLADGYARKQWKGTMGKVDKFMWNNPFGAMYGLNLATRPFDTDKWKTEGNRLKKLAETGVEIPDNMKLAMMLKRGRKKSELVNPNYAADFVGQTKDGFVNNKFANSRNEADLKGQDLTGYSAFFEKFGNDWMKKFNENQRNQIAQTALDNKAVRERHGTMDVTWNPDLEGKISKLTGYKFNQPPATPPIVNKPAPLPNGATPVINPMVKKPAPLAPGQANGFTIPRTTNKSANTVRR